MIQAHMSFLADDLLEGREAGTPGYDVAAAYVAAQFRAYGLSAPANGGYHQSVRFRRAKPLAGTLTVWKGQRSVELDYGDDVLVWGDPRGVSGSVAGEMLFVGFGITAPELKHDDYEGVDARAKIVVMLPGTPPSFPAEAREFYSSTELKHRIAELNGARAIVLVPPPTDDEESAWPEIRRLVERVGRVVWLDQSGNTEAPRLSVAVSSSGRNLLKTILGAALDAPSVSLDGFSGRITYESTHCDFVSANVVGVLAGRDPILSREAVVYTAHLDHIGIGEPLEGDSIYNGAVDNASGVSALLAIAQEFSRREDRPLRSVVFVATTAEEPGLLGSDYFIRHVPNQVARVIAGINMDGATLMQYPLREVIAMGGTNSTLGDMAQAAGRALNLGVTLAPLPTLGSDHWPLSRCGVPTLWMVASGRSDAPLDGQALDAAWMKNRYHTPKDDLVQPLNYEAAARFADLKAELGWRVAGVSTAPAWHSSEFLVRQRTAARAWRCSETE